MKNKTILIIGIGGVGKEHIRAAQNLGLKVIGVDNNREVREKYKTYFANGHITNEWADTIERFAVNPFPVYTRLSKVKEKYDYVVIATPTGTHQKILDEIPVKIPVLVEKPMNISVGDREKVFGGYMYLFAGIKVEKSDQHTFVLAVNDHYNSESWRKKEGIGGDLMTHLLALAYKNFGLQESSIAYTWNNASFIQLTYLDTKVVLIGLYGQSGNNLTVDGKAMEIDYEEIFTKQLQAFVGGKTNRYLRHIENYYASHLKSS